MARAARCLGLVGSRTELDERFAEALALHERTPDVFETARTRLAYGARLRRMRQRVRAREELRAALEVFDGVGPTRWADLASAELAATGQTARRRDRARLTTSPRRRSRLPSCCPRDAPRGRPRGLYS
jgi:hypothetical protein